MNWRKIFIASRLPLYNRSAFCGKEQLLECVHRLAHKTIYLNANYTSILLFLVHRQLTVGIADWAMTTQIICVQPSTDRGSKPTHVILFDTYCSGNLFDCRQFVLSFLIGSASFWCPVFYKAASHIVYPYLKKS